MIVEKVKSYIYTYWPQNAPKVPPVSSAGSGARPYLRSSNQRHIDFPPDTLPVEKEEKKDIS